MRSYIAGRIPTARLLDEAWAACQADEKNVLRNTVLQQVEEGEDKTPNLDSLSDEEVQTLYRGTMRKIAAESRRPSGAL